MRIGLFDSGIGGLNVLSCLLKKYPHHEYIFFGDTINLPYGNKKKEELFSLASDAIDFLISKKVDMIIIACGTISSTCFHDLKKKYSLPLYDIISPTVNYLIKSNYHDIGVIGTTRTIESNIFMINKKNILMKSTPSFVPIIENNQIEEKREEIEEELKCFKNCQILVLGCTHYPMLKKIITDNMHLEVLDMGECLVNSLELNNNTDSLIELYFSKIDENLQKNIQNIILFPYHLYQK